MKITNSRNLLSLVLLFFCVHTSAQFHGKIIDDTTNKPIPNATVTGKGILGTTSMNNGTFEIDIVDYPCIISISHLAYQPVDIVIQSPTQDGLEIIMVPKAVEIEQVVISQNRIKRYLANKDFYVVDYDFIGDNIYVIGFENKNLSKGKVILLNPTEDTLGYCSIKKPRKLFRDAFGNIHLITKDSIFQLYYDSSNLRLLYPSTVDEIPMDFLNLKFVNGAKFLFKNISPFEQSHQYYVVDTLNRAKENLTNIVNYQLHPSEGTGVEYGGARKGIPSRANLRTLAEIQAARDEFEMAVYDMAIIHFPVHSYVFRLGAGFVIADLTNKQFLHYNDQFELISKVKAKLPKHKQRQKTVIQDPSSEKMYWVHYRGSKVLLGEINPYSGEIVSSIETPSLPFIENIKIRNGVIWFTYQPRLGETARSLFKMR
jgi:hypothetical protein